MPRAQIPLVWVGRFAQVVAEGRARCALQGLSQHCFGPVLLKTGSGIEPFELGVFEGIEHAVGAPADGWKERGALADP